MLSNDIAYYSKHDEAMSLVHKKCYDMVCLVYVSDIREFKMRCGYSDREFNCG
jgi:hypothetical protein